ncbi:YdcF family protein [Alloscardovia macacae]|uniref:DUF218 domain-containing protein n=1 Tax=Alloscardovia macacae TaxID=1160091 RepID=A0A261F5H5_9BIFI|nr:YdcF family protein [Alloscardovia macacae]OZG54397.1 hypothetical protein ALMA_0858 [Alloscardovia macacae]
MLLRREGFSKANVLSGALGLIIIAFYALAYVRMTSRANAVAQSPLLNSLSILAFSSYLIFGFAFLAFMLYSILYAFIPKRKHYDFIIIHGAGLLGGERVTPLLQRRIEKAVQAWRPGMRIIASGGQGADEKVSEARAIANFLYEHTVIPHDAILLEERSTTTRENLLYSKELGEKLVENPRFLFVTNGYHVFRTSAYARSVGMKGDGLGCTTARYYIPSAFIREFVAVCVRWKWLFIVYYAIIILGLLISYL